MARDQERENRVHEILGSHNRLGREELMVLRMDALHFTAVAPGGRTPMLNSRLQIELVDSLAELSKNLLQVNKSIEVLNTSSGELVSETNKLTRRIFWLTVVGVIMTIAGGGIAALQLFGGLK